MDFSISEEQASILLSVDKMISKFLPPEEVRRRDKNYEPPDFLLKYYAELGLLGIPFPEKYGGLDGSLVDSVVLMEALGRGLVLEPMLSSVLLGRPDCL